MFSKLAGWALVALLIYCVITDPGGSAHLVQTLAGDLGHVANSASQFVLHL